MTIPRLTCVAFVVLGTLQGQEVPPAPADGSKTASIAEEDVRQRPALAALFPRFRDVMDALEAETPKLAEQVFDTLAARARRQEPQGLEFVRQHDPELSMFLLRLRETRRRAYDGAIRELLADLRTLDVARADGEEAHRLAMQRWKAKTRVRLLAARLARSSEPEVEVALVEALEAEESARREQLREDRRRLERRLAQIDAALAEDAEQRVRGVHERMRKQLERRSPGGR